MAMLEVNNLSIQFGGLRAVDGFKYLLWRAACSR